MLSVWIIILCGIGIGVILSLAGIGGGFLLVFFLNWYGIEMKKVIGFLLVCGFVIVILGMIGFILYGY